MGEQLTIQEVDSHLEKMRTKAAEQLGQDALELVGV